MLQILKELHKSITIEQRKEIDPILGDDLSRLLDLLLQTDTEEDAENRLREFKSLAKKSPVKVFKMRRKLTAHQKSLIMQLVEDE